MTDDLHNSGPIVCAPCADGEHADDGDEMTCPCCGKKVR